jgi:hypothetical protein
MDVPTYSAHVNVSASFVLATDLERENTLLWATREREREREREGDLIILEHGDIPY